MEQIKPIKVNVDYGFESMPTHAGVSYIDPEWSDEEKAEKIALFERLGVGAYERIRDEYFEDKKTDKYIINISMNFASCIKACFEDSGWELVPENLQTLFIVMCYEHEGFYLKCVKEKIKELLTDGKIKMTKKQQKELYES